MRRIAISLIIIILILLAFSRLVLQPTGLVVGERSARGSPSQTSEQAGNDLTRLFLPLHTRVSDALRKAGHIPSWDPAGFGGRPLVGNPQAGLWYPPSWLFWWLREPSLFGWLTVAHLIWSAF